MRTVSLPILTPLFGSKSNSEIFHSDVNNDRTLPLRTGANDMTVEKCIDFCVSKGYSFAGVEYSTECYCGNSVAQDRLGPFSKCLMPCGGNGEQFCGGPSRLSLYKKASGAKPVNPPPSSSTSTKASTTVAPAPKPTTTKVTSTTPKPTSVKPTATSALAKPTPTNVAVPSGWTYAGCWVDPVNPRTLATVGYWGKKIESSGCINHCSSKGFKYAGTEFGGECFCSNTLVGGKSAPESECNMPCEGNNIQKCGGPARLSLFAKAGAVVSKTKKRSSLRARHSKRHGHHL